MYYIGLDVHKKTISYCVKDASGRVHQEGKLGATRRELDIWMRTLPQPWTVAMEATIFTGWIYDHLHPHATQIKVAHPLMLRAIAAAKKKNDRVDASKIVYLRGSLRSDREASLPCPPFPRRALPMSDRSRYDSVLLQYRAKEERKECLACEMGKGGRG